jgi:ATP/maltotriose-dependent transcriptional regulator MalT
MEKIQASQGKSDPLAAGQAALARGAWEEARDCFRAELEGRAAEPGASTGESPQVWEGLGQACWWLEDQAGTFEARERAYALYRQRDDRQSAARMAIWLALDYVDFRAESGVADGWLQRARRLLEGLDPTPELGMVFLLDGHVALMSDNDIPRARQCASQALAIARSTGSLDVEVLSLAIEGLARVSEGEIAEGMRLLDEATTAALAGEVSDLNAVGSTCCYLIHACERVRDYDRATQWCLQVRDFCRRWRFTSMFTVCRTQYASVLIHRGEWAEAEAELTAATDEIRATRPAGVASGIVRLAELRRRQGRTEEAGALFEAARRHRLAPLGLGELALDRGDATSAADMASQYLRRIPCESRTERVAGIELRVRADVARGARESAFEALSELRETARILTTGVIRAMALFAEGIVAVAFEADPERARCCFEDATHLFEDAKAPYDAGRTRLELARTLVALGRREAAREEARQAEASLERLGAAHLAAEAAALAREMDASAGTVASPESPPTPSRAASPLTSREIDVLRLIAKGFGDKEIADRLCLSPHTIHRHVSNLLTKLDVSSRAAAVGQASRLGLL